jgi:hypothetical protein
LKDWNNDLLTRKIYNSYTPGQGGSPSLPIPQLASTVEVGILGSENPLFGMKVAMEAVDLHACRRCEGVMMSEPQSVLDLATPRKSKNGPAASELRKEAGDMLRDVAFVLALTRRVRKEILIEEDDLEKSPHTAANTP